MADVNSLANRIDAHFAAVQEKVKDSQAAHMQGLAQRRQRLEQLNQTFDQLRDLWGPRLELLLQKFGDRVQTTPRIVPSTREVTFAFQSHLARVSLHLSASTDRDIQKVILACDVDIIPILFEYNAHSELAFPLDAVDKEAVAKWLDDRIVEFVATYLSMGENEIYLKEYMVEDPITHVRFPSMAAGDTLEWQGKKYYFVGEETRREFEKQQVIASK